MAECARPSAVHERLDQRRLAGAVRADQRDVLAALEHERRRRSSSCLSPAARSTPSASTTVRPLRAGFRNSKPSVRRPAPGASTRTFSIRSDLLQLRLRLARLRPVAEPGDEALEPLDVFGLALGELGLERERAPPSPAARRATCRGSRSTCPPSSSSTAVPTDSRNQRSCATRITAASSVESSCSSHSIEAMSRWFVGSSRRSRSGSPASARASEARVSSPPEKVSSAAVEVGVGEAEPAQHGDGAVAPGVAARMLEPRLRLAVAAERLGCVVAGGHRLLEAPQLALGLDEVARRRRARTRAARGPTGAAGAGRAARSGRPSPRRARRPPARSHR